MKKGTYVGAIAHLAGKTAIIRNMSEKGYVVAQFDDRSLTLSGNPIPKRVVLEYEPHARFPVEHHEDYPEPPIDALGYGWHRFREHEFKVETEQ